MNKHKKILTKKNISIFLPAIFFLTLFILSKYEIAGFEQLGYAIGYYGTKLITFCF